MSLGTVAIIRYVNRYSLYSICIKIYTSKEFNSVSICHESDRVQIEFVYLGMNGITFNERRRFSRKIKDFLISDLKQ